MSSAIKVSKSPFDIVETWSIQHLFKAYNVSSYSSMIEVHCLTPVSLNSQIPIHIHSLKLHSKACTYVRYKKNPAEMHAVLQLKSQTRETVEKSCKESHSRSAVDEERLIILIIGCPKDDTTQFTEILGSEQTILANSKFYKLFFQFMTSDRTVDYTFRIGVSNFLKSNEKRCFWALTNLSKVTSSQTTGKGAMCFFTFFHCFFVFKKVWKKNSTGHC